MFRFRISSIIIYAIVLTAVAQRAFAIKCWFCSTQTDGKFCDDKFDASNRTDPEYDQLECGTGKCLKMYLVSDSDSKRTYLRGCTRFIPDFDERTCNRKHPSPNACFTCATNLCNDAVQFSSITLFVVIPVTIAKQILL